MITARDIFDQQSEADKAKLIDYLRNNQTSRRIFRTDFTQPFFDDLAKRRDSKIESHIVLTTWGYTGTYKSSAKIEIARFMDKNFSADKIAFTNQELLNLVQTQHTKGFILRDEITVEFGTGSGRQQAFLQMQGETLRKSQISFGYISPELKPIGTEHYLLHSIGHNDFKVDDEGKPIEQVYMLLGIVNPATHNYLGGVIIEIEWDNPVWVGYDKKKIQFMNNVREGNFAKADMEGLAKKCMTDKFAPYAKTRHDWLIIIQRCLPSLTTEESSMLFSMIKMNVRIKKGITNDDFDIPDE